MPAQSLVCVYNDPGLAVSAAPGPLSINHSLVNAVNGRFAINWVSWAIRLQK